MTPRQWAEEHKKCRLRYITILKIENPNHDAVLDRPGLGKGYRRCEEVCKAHNKPMYVWLSKERSPHEKAI